MWMYVLLFQLNFICGGEAVVVGLRNTAVVVGERMEMECQWDKNRTFREWSFQGTLTSKAEKLFTYWSNKSRKLNPRFEVGVEDFGSSMIYVNSTTLGDAGIYTCLVVQPETMEQQEYSAHLIVFESEPVCSTGSGLPLNTTVQEGAYVRLRCTVGFRGILIPEIEWRKHEDYGEKHEEGQEITSLADNVIIQNSSITSELNILFTSNTRPCFYSLKLYFKPVNVSQSINSMTATNAPNYTYTWKTTACIVPPPTNMQSDSTLMLTSVAVSVFAAFSVAVIIFCICRKRLRPNRASKTKRTDIPDLVSGQSLTPPDPVYAEVSRADRKGANSKQGTSRTGDNYSKSSPGQYCGADGTIYMEVNIMNREPMPAKIPAGETAMFSVVGEYASVDHTIRPPKPPSDRIE